jgi:hypothetical protein
MEEDQFSKGYEYRLMDLMNYFSVEKPGYYKPKFLGYERENI